MTLTLTIIRHAKSSWDDPALADHDRVLNARGRAAADAIADWLAGGGHVPDAACCSTAARTVETLDRICVRWPERPGVDYCGRLYHAAPEVILNVVRSARGQSLAVVGHNPGIGAFAAAMATAPPWHDAFHRYPTCATTVLEFEADSWADVRAGTGRILGFVVPRDLDR